MLDAMGDRQSTSGRRPLRILIIQPWIKIGGGELLAVELAAALRQGGDDVTIATLFVEPHGLPSSTATCRYVLPSRWISRRLARSRGLTFLIGPFILLAIVLRAARACDVLNPHNLPGPLIAAVAGPLLRRPIVWTCNEVPEPLPADAARQLGSLETFVWRVGATLSRWAARRPREILVLSEKTRRAVQKAYGRDATVERPGVDLAAFEAVHLGTRSPVTLLFVAKLHPQKDPVLALRILAELRARALDARLTIVGEGPLHAEIRSTIGALGLADHVTIEGGLDVPQLVERYRRSDVLVVTSGGHQSWGLTPFEALAAGTPTVLSIEAGAAEVLGPSQGAVVVARSAVDFADAIVALQLDQPQAERIVANGRRVAAALTWPRYAAACRVAYARALGHDRLGLR